MTKEDKSTTYLDNSATTQPRPAVIEAMAASMRERYFNPSSLYAQAVEVERGLAACRQEIDRALGGGGQAVFTSGGTEANNLAILGGLAALRPGGTVLYSAGEHPSVIEACKAATSLGFTPKAIPLTGEGLVDLAALEQMVGEDVVMICAMQVNNETGALYQLSDIVDLRNKACPHALLHVDGVQGYLRHSLSLRSLGVDSYALSGHKIHGPKGVGALWVGPRMRLNARAHGGGQEKGLRSGTENTPGIIGMEKAMEEMPATSQLKQNKLGLWRTIKELVPEAVINGPPPDSEMAAVHILNVSFPPVRAETMLHALEAEGILVGNGSACSSRKNQGSHVLRAMGVPRQRLDTAIRFSLSPYQSQEDLEPVAQAVAKCYQRLKPYTRK